MSADFFSSLLLRIWFSTDSISIILALKCLKWRIFEFYGWQQNDANRTRRLGYFLATRIKNISIVCITKNPEAIPWSMRVQNPGPMSFYYILYEWLKHLDLKRMIGSCSSRYVFFSPKESKVCFMCLENDWPDAASTTAANRVNACVE